MRALFRMLRTLIWKIETQLSRDLRCKSHPFSQVTTHEMQRMDEPVLSHSAQLYIRGLVRVRGSCIVFSSSFQPLDRPHEPSG